MADEMRHLCVAFRWGIGGGLNVWLKGAIARVRAQINTPHTGSAINRPGRWLAYGDGLEEEG